MEVITRYIKRERSSGYTQTFDYTTYDIIFSEAMKKKDPNIAKLFDFMRLGLEAGLPDRDQSPSGMPELIGLDVKRIDDHPLEILVEGADYHGKGNMQHLTVQRYFQKECPSFLAMEVPVWNEEASGCIDILLLKTNPFKVTVYDFKPNALAEKKAASQVYRYAIMLIEATGISPEYFEAFYGDEKDTFEILLTKQSHEQRN